MNPGAGEGSVFGPLIFLLSFLYFNFVDNLRRVSQS